MQKLFHLSLGAIAGAALALLATAPGLLPLMSGAIASPRADAGQTYRQLELFGKVFDMVRRDYVEKPDDKKMIASAINGMVSGLDPHSNYMDAKSFNDMQAETSGQFGGLGMQVTMENGLVKVVSPIDDTPAAKAGILAGDIITRIDDQVISGLPLNDVVTKLRGNPGSSVKLEIQRASLSQPIEKTLTREIIKVRSVRYHVEGGDVGYIRITEFNNLAGDELTDAIKHISSEVPADHLKGYILDLRNNPGGLLDQAVAVSDAFIKSGEIVSIRGRDSRRRPAFLCQIGRPHERQAIDGSGQRWFCVSFGDCGRCFARSKAGDDYRYPFIRQRIGSDDYPAWSRQRRSSSHHRALLHAVGPYNPSRGHHAGHQGRAASSAEFGGSRGHKLQRGESARTS